MHQNTESCSCYWWINNSLQTVGRGLLVSLQVSFCERFQKSYYSVGIVEFLVPAWSDSVQIYHVIYLTFSVCSPKYLYLLLLPTFRNTDLCPTITMLGEGIHSVISDVDGWGLIWLVSSNIRPVRRDWLTSNVGNAGDNMFCKHSVSLYFWSLSIYLSIHSQYRAVSAQILA